MREPFFLRLVSCLVALFPALFAALRAAVLRFSFAFFLPLSVWLGRTFFPLFLACANPLFAVFRVTGLRFLCTFFRPSLALPSFLRFFRLIGRFPCNLALFARRRYLVFRRFSRLVFRSPCNCLPLFRAPFAVFLLQFREFPRLFPPRPNGGARPPLILAASFSFSPVFFPFAPLSVPVRHIPPPVFPHTPSFSPFIPLSVSCPPYFSSFFSVSPRKRLLFPRIYGTIIAVVEHSAVRRGG